MGTKMKWIVAASLATLAAGDASAIALRDGFGGPAGYGELTQPPNDDGSSNLLNLPFSLNFFGTTYDSFFVNNNGSISFGQPVGTYTPRAFPASLAPMIAPYWGDVDTRCATCGAVYVGSNNSNEITVTWNNVGYFSQHPDKLNNFQMTLVNQNSTGTGNFDIEFRYDRLEWTTGDASGGAGGLGGVPAQAGYDAGNGQDYFTLPGSRQPGVLSLANLTNVAGGQAGLWVLNVRNGEVRLDGSTPATPLLPGATDPQTGGYSFDFGVDLNQRVYVDPDVATGYVYQVDPGNPLITAAEFASALTDPDGYQIYALNADGTRGAFLGDVMVGGTFDFLAAVSGFWLEGIDPINMLDPNNTLAFVAGFSFDSAGQVHLTQTPITTFVANPSGVPEPATWAMMLLGFGMVGVAARRKARPALA